MTYEWDDAKNQFNLVKHGIYFADIERFDWNRAVSISSNRHGESRIAAIARAIAFGITSSSQAPFRGNPGISPTGKAPGMGIKENAMVSDARVFTPTFAGGRL